MKEKSNDEGFAAAGNNGCREHGGAIKDGDSFYYTLSQISPVGIFRTDVHDNCLYVNERWCKITGMKQSEAIPGKFPRVVHPDDHERVAQAWYTSKQARLNFILEYRIRRPDGDVRWVLGQATAEKDSAGSLVGYIGSITDITQIKESEDALRNNEERLRQSEEKLRAYLGNISDVVWLIKLSPGVGYVSPGITRMLGFLPEEVIGQPASEYIHPEDIGTILDATKYVMEHPGEPCTIEYRVRHKDGHWIHVETTGRNMLDNSAIRGILIIMRDITERKKAQDALRESEASMRAILDYSPYMIWLKDTSGHYVNANKAFAEYAKLAHIGQIKGKTDLDLWPKKLAEKYRADDAEVIATRRQKNVEEQALDGDRVYWVETFKTAIIDENDRVLGTAGFSRDVTERKQAEEQIHNLAYYDTLTQLPNRRMLNDRMGLAMASSKRSGHYGALLFLDLDNFKSLNDRFGHAVGDLLLKEVARRVSSSFARWTPWRVLAATSLW